MIFQVFSISLHLCLSQSEVSQSFSSNIYDNIIYIIQSQRIYKRAKLTSEIFSQSQFYIVIDKLKKASVKDAPN